MDNTHIEGRVVTISRPAEVLFSVFADLTNFTANLPADIAGKAEVTVTPDTLVAKVQGFELGMQVTERTPFERVCYQQYGATPIPFTVTINLQQLTPLSTQFQLVLDTQLSGVFKIMLEGKLKEIVEKITSELEKSMP